MPRNPTAATLAKSLQTRLELERGLGVEFVAVGAGARARLAASFSSSSSSPLPPPPSLPPPPRPATGTRRTGPAARQAEAGNPSGSARATLVPYAPPPANPAKEAELSPLRAEAEGCAGCELHRRRTRVAWGEGNPDARVMFIGEAPGRDEDLEGRPFVGRAGSLLTDIIEKGMKIPRGGVYITNVIKCRPPGNRDPRPEELAACARYTNRQFEIIRPEIVVAVGGVAGCALLGLPPGTAGLRGKWHDFRGVPLRVIYHPSYLLRLRRNDGDRTEADREVWRDIQEVMSRLG